MKISEVVNRICGSHEPYDEPPNTRDKYLAGNPDAECNGVIVTVCATMEVLKKAVELGYNLIVSHESIYYGLQKSGQAQENDIVQEKSRYIEAHGLVVWRYHDHMHGKPIDPHRTRPDYIFYGICRELGWQDYVVDDPMKPTLYRIPETSAADLAQFLMDQFDLNGLRIVGNADATITTVCMAEHVMGDRQDHSMGRAMDAQAFIPFEICDFTLTQYVRDAAALGRNKVIFEMGHFNCEELGMKYAVSYIADLLGEDVNVTFVQSGDVYTYFNRRD